MSLNKVTFVDVSPEEYAEYDKQLDGVKKDILENLHSSDWSFAKEESDGCKIFKRSVPTSSYAMIKAVIHIPVPKEIVFQAIKPCNDITPSTPKDKKEGLLERRLINYDENDPTARAFMYCAAEAPVFFVAPRDFLVYRKRIDADNKILYLHTSVKNNKIMPERQGFVRSLMKQQAFIIEDDPSSPEKSILTFILHSEIGGSIPASVYNIAALAQGKSVIGLRKMAISYYASHK